MDIFAKVLQGPYAYLLILQVLIVSGLCLTMIYLILLRLREAPMTAFIPSPPAPKEPVASNTVTIVAHQAQTASVAASAPAPSFPEESSASSPGLVFAPSQSVPEPMTAISMEPPPAAPAGVDPQALATERERASALEQEAAMSKDKVRYLESKLLEYEILQEEIGTLSTLKVENEKLRQELISAKQGQPVAALAAEPMLTASNPAMKSAADTAVDLLAASGATAPEDPGTAIAPPDPAAQSQLDGLITQIDSLTKKSE